MERIKNYFLIKKIKKLKKLMKAGEQLDAKYSASKEHEK